MSISLIGEVWKLLKPSIETGDTDGAAEILVNYLVEEDYSTSEIKATFRGDKNIKDALDFFDESPDDGLYHEEDDYNDLYDDYYNEDEDDNY